MADNSLITEGDLVYQQIRSLIDMYPTDGARYLEEMLNYEMRKYGTTNVLKSLAQAPEESIAIAQGVTYYEDDARIIHSAIQEFADLITGLIPDEEKAKALGNLMDRL